MVFQTPLGMLVAWRGRPFHASMHRDVAFGLNSLKHKLISIPQMVDVEIPFVSLFQAVCFLYLRNKLQSTGIPVVCSVFQWLPGASSNILMDAPLHPKLGYRIDFYPGFS